MSRKRPVEVVVCGDPWANRPFVPKKPRQDGEANGEGYFRPDKGKGKGGREIFDIATASKAVKDLGSTQFAAWQRKQYEQSKIEDLGGRKAKNQKMPLPMLQGIRAKQIKIKGLREEEAKAAGIVVAKANDKDKGRRRDEDGGLGETIVKAGVLRVPKKMLVGKSYTMPKGGGGGGGGGGGKGKGGGKGGKGRDGGKVRGRGKGKGGGKGKGRG